MLRLLKGVIKFPTRNQMLPYSPNLISIIYLLTCCLSVYTIIVQGCGHKFCKTCWQMHFEIQINQVNTVRHCPLLIYRQPRQVHYLYYVDNGKHFLFPKLIKIISRRYLNRYPYMCNVNLRGFKWKIHGIFLNDK
jgi:hypothetical protein